MALRHLTPTAGMRPHDAAFSPRWDCIQASKSPADASSPHCLGKHAARERKAKPLARTLPGGTALRGRSSCLDCLCSLAYPSARCLTSFLFSCRNSDLSSSSEPQSSVTHHWLL